MSDAGGERLTIVGIGASAGGIEAFRGFFENMPSDSGMAFVVVLHLPAARKSLLPEILSRWTAMPIVAIGEGCLVEPNRVYVPPSGALVILRDGRLHPHQLGADGLREPAPIDLFFDSLAKSLNDDAIGIVLSGTGSDGALGLKAIKTCGGLTLAQGTDSGGPQYGSMPASAIATGAVDIVAPVHEMPRRILSVAATRRAREHPDDGSDAEIDAARLDICALVNRQVGHDFSGYKEKTFVRRVQRRMQVLGLARTDAYIARLEKDRAEVGMLFNDLLIGVTSFFRDAETFETLERLVVPRLLAGRGADATIRVWVAGCATGEEAYSLAILLHEHLNHRDGGAPTVQVFATDIDDAAIATARAGRYPSTLLQGMSARRRHEFFVAGNDGSYVVTKAVRELCTFSTHSLTRDPPFSRIDLISCRNLLIYLDTELQSRVVPAFHYALTQNGILLLGSSETVARHDNLFETLDRTHRIFQRRNVPSPPLQLTGRTNGAELAPPNPAGNVPRLSIARSGTRAAARVLERYAPAFVVVSADGEIVQYSARTGRFLEPAPGTPTTNVVMMARRGLRAHLRSALKEAIETGHLAERPRIMVEVAGEGLQRVSLVVEPLAEPGSNAIYLVVFADTPAREIDAKPSTTSDTELEAAADRQLEAELRDTREQLQAITEEHETALEELRSANEELHSVNEELQSANEELETSKEEIQSTNEELQTVNAQLAVKVEELDHKNSDLENLFASTQVATIFLDPYLLIRGFTPAVASIYNLIPSDQGRPLSDIVSRLRYDGLRDDVRQVLATLEPLERRVVRDDDETHYLMRVLPYRTPDSSVDGTLITFVDVTSIVHSEQHQRLLIDELNHRVKNMLTVVISLATQTMRRSQTIEEFGKNYIGRIHALTAAYSLLSNEGWQRVSLHDVVMEELRPFLEADHAGAALEGPRVLLEPRAALALGMAIHELTTNAVKYGALSVPEGRISVTWRVEQAADAEQIVLDWSERNGPPVTSPRPSRFRHDTDRTRPATGHVGNGGSRISRRGCACPADGAVAGSARLLNP